MIVSQRQLTIFLVILITLTGLTYFHRNPTGDDAWFAEQSYWFEKEGVIRSEFFRGILGWEKQLFVSHKLFLVFGAGLIHVFGYHLPVVQFVGLLFFCVIVGDISFYIFKREGKFYSWHLLFILVLIFSNRLLIKTSFENRPELMVAAFGFGSFLCINQSKNSNMKVVLAGVLAGLAMLCHLNGVIFLIAGFFTLIYLKNFREALLFSIACGITGVFYFADIIPVTDGLSTWYYQFRNDPATQNAFGWEAKLMVLFTYPKLFFESPEQAALSILLVYLLVTQRAFIKNLPLFLKLYSLVIFITFWLITKNGSGTYMPLFMPFMLLLIYELYKLSNVKNVSFKFVMALYFIIGLYGTIEIIYANVNKPYLPDAYKQLRPNLPYKKNGLVPLTFFFNEYERHAHLLSNENYKNHATPTNDPANQMAQWAYVNKTDFILMDYDYRPEYFYPKPGTRNLPPYKLTYFDGRFAVYQKVTDGAL